MSTLLISIFLLIIVFHEQLSGLYSDIETDLIGRQALHAEKIRFIHPITKEKMEIVAKLPNDIESLITKIS